MMGAIEEVQFVAEVAIAAVGREMDNENRGRERGDQVSFAMPGFVSDGQAAILMRLALTSMPRRRSHRDRSSPL